MEGGEPREGGEEKEEVEFSALSILSFYSGERVAIRERGGERILLSLLFLLLERDLRKLKKRRGDLSPFSSHYPYFLSSRRAIKIDLGEESEKRKTRKLDLSLSSRRGGGSEKCLGKDRFS